MTLIEVLIVTVLLVLLLMLAVPSFRKQIAASRLDSAANELMVSVARARAESIRLGSRVTSCRSGGSTTACSTTTGEGWELGWLVFQDPTRSGSNAAVDSGETVTFVVQPRGGDIKIVGANGLEDFVSYSADGRARPYGSSMLPSNAKLRVCSTSTALSDDARARDIVVEASGRTSMTRPTGVTSSCPSPT